MLGMRKMTKSATNPSLQVTWDLALPESLKFERQPPPMSPECNTVCNKNSPKKHVQKHPCFFFFSLIFLCVFCNYRLVFFLRLKFGDCHEFPKNPVNMSHPDTRLVVWVSKENPCELCGLGPKMVHAEVVGRWGFFHEIWGSKICRKWGKGQKMMLGKKRFWIDWFGFDLIQLFLIVRGLIGWLIDWLIDWLIELPFFSDDF